MSPARRLRAIDRALALIGFFKYSVLLSLGLTVWALGDVAWTYA